MSTVSIIENYQEVLKFVEWANSLNSPLTIYEMIWIGDWGLSVKPGRWEVEWNGISGVGRTFEDAIADREKNDIALFEEMRRI